MRSVVVVCASALFPPWFRLLLVVAWRVLLLFGRFGFSPALPGLCADSIVLAIVCARACVTDRAPLQRCLFFALFLTCLLRRRPFLRTRTLLLAPDGGCRCLAKNKEKEGDPRR
nr:hypothetical protein [Pandoravirus aubagnensis]